MTGQTSRQQPQKQSVEQGQHDQQRVAFCATSSIATMTAASTAAPTMAASAIADAKVHTAVATVKMTTSDPPIDTIVVSHPGKGEQLVPPEEPHRAVHRIRLSALDHNYACVEAAANRQRCDVIVVVKADGYGHGAIATALHLADVCGCDSFAVATLEEAIALRKAFENNPPGQWNRKLASLFHTHELGPTVGMPTGLFHTQEVSSQQVASQPSGGGGPSVAPSHHPGGGLGGGGGATGGSRSPSLLSTNSATVPSRPMRPSKIRILVLGPPVGFPRCFDDYYHHGIELMLSGPEAAKALMEWVVNEKERKRTQVERAAAETKAQALSNTQNVPREISSNTSAVNTTQPPNSIGVPKGAADRVAEAAGEAPENENQSGDNATNNSNDRPPAPVIRPSSTLNAVQGADLVNEVRAILINQNKAANEKAAQQQQQQQQHQQHQVKPKSTATSADSSVSSGGDQGSCNGGPAKQPAVPSKPAVPGQIFGGIEAAAKSSRQRDWAAKRASERTSEANSFGEASCDSLNAPIVNSNIAKSEACSILSTAAVAPARKTLRWHALVDSGMGRLGFRTEPVEPGEDRRDTVDVLRELVDAEIIGNAPIEFYGMCTHMAEAHSKSDYTNVQIGKFVGLLERVRAAKIFIPTISTDNSSALLTTNLMHFDPKKILSQAHADTRGYVRTGGAIYGQRPDFKQLRAVSTLMASVRHVAIVKKGDSVGYDRAYTAPYDVRIATLTIGFADGYPRDLGNGVGKVAIRGAVFPVAGNVCMDMMMVDLGRVHEENGDVTANIGATVVVGDKAVLWGPLDDEDEAGLVRLQDLAATLKTTQSALTCGLDKIRVQREFV